MHISWLCLAADAAALNVLLSLLAAARDSDCFSHVLLVVLQ